MTLVLLMACVYLQVRLYIYVNVEMFLHIIEFPLAVCRLQNNLYIKTYKNVTFRSFQKTINEECDRKTTL